MMRLKQQDPNLPAGIKTSQSQFAPVQIPSDFLTRTQTAIVLGDRPDSEHYFTQQRAHVFWTLPLTHQHKKLPTKGPKRGVDEPSTYKVSWEI